MSPQGTPRNLEIEPKLLNMLPKRCPETGTQKNIEIYHLRGTLGHRKPFEFATPASKIMEKTIPQSLGDGLKKGAGAAPFMALP